MVELDAFVEATLIAIVRGATAARKVVKDLGGEVNPSIGNANATKTITDDYNQAIVSVDFDVAVAATEAKENKGGMGVAIALLGMGATQAETSGFSHASRIKFTVPLVLPKGT